MKNLYIPCTLGVLIGLLFFLYSKNTSLSHNIDTLTDSIRYHQLRNGELLAETKVLKSDKESLLNHLEMSKREYKELEQKVGKIRYITKVQTRVVVDTVTILRDTIIDSTVYKSFEYKDKYTQFSGVVSDSLDFKLSMDVPLTVGYSGSKFFITSPNPYVHISDIKAGEVRKRWSIGLYGGVGVSYGTKGLDVGPQIGIGFIYKL